MYIGLKASFCRHLLITKSKFQFNHALIKYLMIVSSSTTTSHCFPVPFLFTLLFFIMAHSFAQCPVRNVSLLRKQMNSCLFLDTLRVFFFIINNIVRLIDGRTSQYILPASKFLTGLCIGYTCVLCGDTWINSFAVVNNTRRVLTNRTLDYRNYQKHTTIRRYR